MTIRETLGKLVETPASSRVYFIRDFLVKNGIPHRVIDYGHGKNIEVFSGASDQSGGIILSAHYDIYHGISEGANDNSSSVAVLLHLAMEMGRINPTVPVRLLFNDHEELLGGLLNRTLPLSVMEELIQRSGSFHYFTHSIDREKIMGVFVLEMCGIGDAVMVGSRSGNILSHPGLIEYTESSLEKSNVPFVRMPFLFCDMASVYFAGLKGIVMGTVNRLEAQYYINSDYKIFPSSWKNIHTRNDTIYSIREKSLELIFYQLLELIKNAERIGQTADFSISGQM